jgi:hypothetical protein
MKSASVFTVIVFAAALSACGSKDLAGDQAKSLINDFFTAHPTTQQLLTGMDNIGTDTEAEYFAKPGGKYQKALEADGLITITSKGKIYNPANHKEYFNALDIQLTDKSKPLVTGKPVTAPPLSANTWPTVYENAIFCGKEVVTLGEVSTNDDSASVDYTWRAAKLTAFADDFHKTDPTDKTTCNPTVVVNATAAFERKDNVWKLTVAQ